MTDSPKKPLDSPPADLIARIEQLTDARMCDLLDHAVGPDAADQARVQRIMTATCHRSPIIGRVGFFSVVFRGWRSVAAAIILSGLSIIVWSLSPSTETTTFAEIEIELKTLSELDTAAAGTFERQLAQVSASLDTLAADGSWATSSEAAVDRAAEVVDWFDETPLVAGTPTWF